jgi:hypothetical protein
VFKFIIVRGTRSVKHRLSVFENRVLRRIFGPRREEMVGGWRRLHNDELHNVYGSPNIIGVIKPRRMTSAGHVTRMRDMTNAYKIPVGKHEGKRQLGRRKHRWEANIRMDIRETVWVVVDWMHLAQDRGPGG